MQIVQELCKRPGLNKCGFDMPTIYIPNPNKVSPSCPASCIPITRYSYTSVTNPLFSPATLPPPCKSQPSRCVNQIEEVCRTIEKTINQTVQNTLNSLEKDCELISEAITDTLLNDRCNITSTLGSPNWKQSVTPPHTPPAGWPAPVTGGRVARAACWPCWASASPWPWWHCCCWGLCPRSCWSWGWAATAQRLCRSTWSLPFFFFFCQPCMQLNGMQPVWLFLFSHCLQTPVIKLLDSLTGEQQLYACAALVLLSFILLIIARFSFRYAATSWHNFNQITIQVLQPFL